MKITKRVLNFDLVLDGEKINSLDELREHPSTELLEMHKDGRLSRWLRAHGGTNEADKICELLLSGNTARDLYAICQILAVDIELEDIIDALKNESQKDTVPACDSVEEEYCKNMEEDPEIKERKDMFLNSAERFVDEIKNIIEVNLHEEKGDKKYEYKINTNIDSFKDKEHVDFISDLNYITSDYGYNLRCNIPVIINDRNCINGKLFVLNGEDIFIKDDIIFKDPRCSDERCDYVKRIGECNSTATFGYAYFRAIQCIIIKGENVVIDFKDPGRCKFIFIIAKNLYIHKIVENTYIVAENIFIERQNTGDYENNIDNSIVCAKNTLSIGYGWGIPPFMKTKEELISQNVSIKRDYHSNPHLFLSAGTFLYGCRKEGSALETTLAIPCYNVMKKTMLDWAEENGIFTPDFWNLEDK